MFADDERCVNHFSPVSMPQGNWRTHPEAQQQGLAAAIAEVGWAGALLYNERTKRLVDGHARKEQFAGKGLVPVLVGSWSEEQERIILATLDPLSAMAQANTPALDALLASIQLSDGALGALLESLKSPDMLVSEAAVPEPKLPAEPELASAHLVEIRCDAGQLERIRPTLIAWCNDGLSIDIS
jgi:hypothetical protein